MSIELICNYFFPYIFLFERSLCFGGSTMLLSQPMLPNDQGERTSSRETLTLNNTMLFKETKMQYIELENTSQKQHEEPPKAFQQLHVCLRSSYEQTKDQLLQKSVRFLPLPQQKITRISRLINIGEKCNIKYNFFGF